MKWSELVVAISWGWGKGGEAVASKIPSISSPLVWWLRLLNNLCSSWENKIGWAGDGSGDSRHRE